MNSPYSLKAFQPLFITNNLHMVFLHGFSGVKMKDLKMILLLLLLLQLWAPVTIGGKRLLSTTSAQPFAVRSLGKNLKKYRLHSMEYQYNIDMNMQLCNIDDEEDDPKILSGGPASAFLNRLPELLSLKHHQDSPLARYAFECGLMFSYMLPICSPSQPSSCIAVLEASESSIEVHSHVLRQIKREVEAINGLEPEKEKIKAALDHISKLLQLYLAQVWIACEDENHVPFSSSLEAPQAKPMFALKLTGYINEDFEELWSYYDTCDWVSLKAGVEPVVKTLQDHKPRFCKNLGNMSNTTLISSVTDESLDETSALIICLRSSDIGNLNYAFEFIWNNVQSYVIKLEVLLFTLYKCLPSFKFYSGAELCDELHVIDVENSTDTETETFKIFQGKRVSPMTDALEKGKKPMLVDHRAASEEKHKTAPKLLYQEEIEQQFGKSMKEAAENLNELGDELNVIDVENFADTAIEFSKILKESRESPLLDVLEKRKKYKTAPIELSREVIEQQFGNTQKVAARNLNVSESTLKRKCKECGISEWQGRRKVVKKAIDSCNRNEDDNGAIHEPSAANRNENTLTRNEDDNGAIHEPSAVNRNENTLTIKAEYGADTIKFTINISEATFVTVEKEIGKRFKMTLGTYKLKYHDEVEWILLTCDEDMSDCIKSKRNVRLLVIPAT